MPRSSGGAASDPGSVVGLGGDEILVELVGVDEEHVRAIHCKIPSSKGSGPKEQVPLWRKWS